MLSRSESTTNFLEIRRRRRRSPTSDVGRRPGGRGYAPPKGVLVWAGLRPAQGCVGLLSRSESTTNVLRRTLFEMRRRMSDTDLSKRLGATHTGSGVSLVCTVLLSRSESAQLTNSLDQPRAHFGVRRRRRRRRRISRTFVGCARGNESFLLGAFVFPPRSERYEIVAN